MAADLRPSRTYARSSDPYDPSLWRRARRRVRRAVRRAREVSRWTYLAVLVVLVAAAAAVWLAMEPVKAPPPYVSPSSTASPASVSPAP